MTRDYRKARAIVAAALPGSIKDIVISTKLHRMTVERWVNDLRAAGESRIVQWRRPLVSGHFVAVHGAGGGNDAPCRLKKISRVIHWKKYTAKIGAEGIERRRLKTQARYWDRMARKQVNPWFGALITLRAMPQQRNSLEPT